MALPTILVNSATGSDTQASGAGPSTALFGTTDASTDGAGTTVTLTAGTNLSGVATDGSHVIFLNDSTAGARNFGKITGSAGSGGATPTVTVANAFGLTLSGKSWAIGGKRASVGGTTSVKLFVNNSGNGDAMPGWIVEMQSGHSESTGQISVIRSGDTTDGKLTLRGASGAATTPLLTFTNNGIAFALGTSTKLWTFRDFEVRNSNATKTASSIFTGSGSQQDIDWIGIKCAHSTNKFWKAFDLGVNNGGQVRDCELGYTASTCIRNSFGAIVIKNNYIHDCAGDAIQYTATSSAGALIEGNLIYNNAGHGIVESGTISAVNPRHINFNTIVGNTGSAIRITSSAIGLLQVENNLLASNGVDGIVFTAVADGAISGGQIVSVRGNQTFGNTGVAYRSTTAGYAYNACPWADGDFNLDPSFTNAAGGDFSIGTNLRAKAYPVGGTLTVGKYSSTNSYHDPGAAQHVDSGGAASTNSQRRGIGGS